MKYIIGLVGFVLFFGCKDKAVDYNNIPLYSKYDNIQAVIEIPAGTNHKIEFNKKALTFEVDQRDGKDRIIDFLPYIGNYGFIPSTYSDPLKGGDGDALDIMVLSESLATSTVIEVAPIAVLKLIDDGELDYKIIAVPTRANQQIIKATNYEQFSINYPEVKQMIALWFLSYDKAESARIEGWGNDKEAMADIKKWEVIK